MAVEEKYRVVDDVYMYIYCRILPELCDENHGGSNNGVGV